MKKQLSILATLVVCLGLVACGQSSSNAPLSAASQANSTVAANTSSKSTPSPAALAASNAPSVASSAPQRPTSAAASKTQIAKEVPQQYQGLWAGKPEFCHLGSSEGRLKINARSIEYYESQGAITQVKLLGNNQIEITAKLSGEGSTWINTARYALSADGTTLTDITRKPRARHRC